MKEQGTVLVWNISPVPGLSVLCFEANDLCWAVSCKSGFPQHSQKPAAAVSGMCRGDSGKTLCLVTPES